MSKFGFTLLSILIYSTLPDTITKKHNGKISVRGVEGEYAEFLIVLPTGSNAYI